MAESRVTDYLQGWLKSLNRGDVSAVDRVFAPDCRIHINGGPTPTLNVAEFKQFVSSLLTAFPDLRFTIDDQIDASNKVAIRWTAVGTNTDVFGELPATGKRVTVRGLILDRVINGQVAERWELWDQMSMLQQLGLT